MKLELAILNCSELIPSVSVFVFVFVRMSRHQNVQVQPIDPPNQSHFP